MMELDPEVEEKYLQAGAIASKAIECAKSALKPGILLLDLANSVEGKIRDFGGSLAFPANLSINNEAAHYTPSFDDTRVLGEHDLIKVDLGVQVDGYIADCAFSYSADEAHKSLIEASKAALSAAVKTVKAGVKTREVGQVIYDEITSRGFRPVANLCGHSLAKYEVHGGVEVPNIPRGTYEFCEGDTFAIEPFATDGDGMIRDLPNCEIFSLSTGKSRLAQSRALQQYVLETFGNLPFSARSIPQSVLSGQMLKMALADLAHCGGLHAYPVLGERTGKLVSQAETTIIVKEDRAVSTVKAIIP